MSLKPVIDDIADQADDFLEGVTTPADARSAISEQLTIKYPSLSSPERARVIDGVLMLLISEGFFDFGVGTASEEIDGVDEG